MPEKMPDESKSHYILGLLLFITGLLVILVVVIMRSQADNSTTSVSINNDTPSVNAITISDSSQGPFISNLDLNENTTKNVYVYGSYSDNNGCSDVATSGSLKLNFYRFFVASGINCSQNDLNCYNNLSTGYSCNASSVPGDSCSGGTDTTANYQCSVPVEYFADATDAGPYNGQSWTATITATDAAGATSTQSAFLTINTLTALDVTPSINYGNMSLSAISAYDVTSTITNTGNNDALDVQISGTSMSCTVGTIPVGNQHFSHTALTAYGSMTALTGTPATQDVNIPKATSVGSPSTDNFYWKLQVPSSGLSGSCSGTTTFSAI